MQKWQFSVKYRSIYHFCTKTNLYNSMNRVKICKIQPHNKGVLYYVVN